MYRLKRKLHVHENTDFMHVRKFSCFQNFTCHLPISDSNMTTFRKEQGEDSVCCTLISYCRIGLPIKSLPSCMNPTGSFEETSHYMAIFFCNKNELPSCRSCKNKFYISFIRATRAYSVAAFKSNQPFGG